MDGAVREVRRDDRVAEYRFTTDEGEYVVTYGCGQGAILQPDGTWLRYEDHRPGCEHEAPEDGADITS